MKNGNNSQTRLQRGHFTLKSSALAPTAMSYMGQDLIANHMKSHYRRILSAKAAVDTSPPKSMQMHIKVRDQKKRAVLESRAGTPLSLRTRSPSMEFLSSSHDETSAMNSARSQQSPGQRPATGTPVQSPGRRTSTGTPIQRSLSMQSLNRHYPPAVPSPSPREMTARGKSTSTSSARPPLHPPVSPIAKESRRTLRTGHQLRHKKDLRTVQSLDKSEKTTPADNYLDNNVRTLLGTYDEPDDIKVPMTAGYSTVGERSQESDTMSHGLNNTSTSSSVRHEGVPRLDLTQVSYSHRGPPSIRSMNDSTDLKASIWEEEQQYLKFISDVTTDILARGIFSNRVLQQVFEMHIDKRKDHLDESRLWEMIEQLKEDLGITDS